MTTTMIVTIAEKVKEEPQPSELLRDETSRLAGDRNSTLRSLQPAACLDAEFDVVGRVDRRRRDARVERLDDHRGRDPWRRTIELRRRVQDRAILGEDDDKRIGVGGEVDDDERPPRAELRRTGLRHRRARVGSEAAEDLVLVGLHPAGRQPAEEDAEQRHPGGRHASGVQDEATTDAQLRPP